MYSFNMVVFVLQGEFEGGGYQTQT